jgi:hypothetical protein
MLEFASNSVCPSCGSWKVRASYTASATGAALRESVSGECGSCRYVWVQESCLEAG